MIEKICRNMAEVKKTENPSTATSSKVAEAKEKQKK